MLPLIFLVQLLEIRGCPHQRHILWPVRIKEIVMTQPASLKSIPKHDGVHLPGELIHAPLPVAVYPLARGIEGYPVVSA